MSVRAHLICSPNLPPDDLRQILGSPDLPWSDGTWSVSLLSVWGHSPDAVDWRLAVASSRNRGQPFLRLTVIDGAMVQLVLWRDGARLVSFAQSFWQPQLEAIREVLNELRGEGDSTLLMSVPLKPSERSQLATTKVESDWELAHRLSQGDSPRTALDALCGERARGIVAPLNARGADASEELLERYLSREFSDQRQDNEEAWGDWGDVPILLDALRLDWVWGRVSAADSPEAAEQDDAPPQPAPQVGGTAQSAPRRFPVLRLGCGAIAILSSLAFWGARRAFGEAGGYSVLLGAPLLLGLLAWFAVKRGLGKLKSGVEQLFGSIYGAELMIPLDVATRAKFGEPMVGLALLCVHLGIPLGRETAEKIARSVSGERGRILSDRISRIWPRAMAAEGDVAREAALKSEVEALVRTLSGD